jgi:hypothetical protein
LKRYFYLAASLPELSLHIKPPLSFSEFLLDFDVQLTQAHKGYVGILRESIDIENIRRLLMEYKLDSRGTLSEGELDEALLVKVNLPEYAIDFLLEYTTKEARLAHFAALNARFFAAHNKTESAFLNQYLSFERALKLWSSLFRAQKLGIDYKQVLQFEDPQDPLIMFMLVQNPLNQLEVPSEFKVLKEIFLTFSQNPVTLHKKIEEFRLNKINEIIEDDFFSLDIILGFLAKLLIIEQWQSLNYEEGQRRLNHFSTKH